MALKEIIEQRIFELENLMQSGNYEEAEKLIPNITKFCAVLSEEQRDFINAAKYAVAQSEKWK
jgi:hypothetical protein